jgi:hypothetical protein
MTLDNMDRADEYQVQLEPAPGPEQIETVITLQASGWARQYPTTFILHAMFFLIEVDAPFTGCAYSFCS